jgi:alginate O-acetyltransferase complex protein AlgI
MLVVMGGWVLFRCETLTQAGHYYAALAGLAPGGGLHRSLAEFVDPFVVLMLAVGIVFSTPLARMVGAWRDRASAVPGVRGKVAMTLDMAWIGIVFVLASAFLAASTYNPFIYFRF